MNYCKPSGTLSLLPGVTSGCHPAYGRHLIRRIRVASNHDIVDVARRSGYHVEYVRRFDGTEDRGTCVIEFPFSYPAGTTLAEEMSAIDQLEVVRRLQTEWSDNAVSCTVYYRPDELSDIRSYLMANFNKTFKTLSFLRHSDHGFDQAPLEVIDAGTYERLVASTVPINSLKTEMDLSLDDECAGGACPIR